MDDEQIVARGTEAVTNGCTEMHIVGGLHHQKKFEWYKNIIELLANQHPSLHLKAWTPVEINWFEFLTKRSIRDILQELVEAGLGSLPGEEPKYSIRKFATRFANTRQRLTSGLKSTEQLIKWVSGPIAQCCMATSKNQCIELIT